jgi:hypothetical protein
MATMRWKTLPLMILSAVSIAGAQDLPKLIDSPLAGTLGPEANDASGVEFSPNGTRVLVTQGASLSLLDSTTLRAIWNRHLSGDLQAGFTNDNSAIFVYSKTTGQVIELDPATGAVRRLVGSYEAGRTLRVGTTYFSLFSVSDVDTTIARFYRTSDGGFVREWSDERVELLTGNKGFSGAGATEYFYSRRSRIKVSDGSVERYRVDANNTHAMYLGGDELGNVVQAVWTRSGEYNGTFQNLRVVRADGSILNLPAPAAGESVSFAGFYIEGGVRTVTVLTQKVVSGVPSVSARRYSIVNGASTGSINYTSAVAGTYAASHVPFGRKMSLSTGRMISFRPDPLASTSIGTFYPGSSVSTRSGEIIGSISGLVATTSGALYSSWTTVSGAKREGLAFIPRKGKAVTWEKFQPGTWTGTGTRSVFDSSPGNTLFGHAVSGKTGTPDAVDLYSFWTGVRVGRLEAGYNSLAFVNEADLFAQRTSGNKIDLLRLASGSLSSVLTIDDSGTFPLTFGGGKLAVINYTASRKDLKLYDTTGASATLALTTQPIRAKIGTDKVLTLVSFGPNADQIKLDRYNVAGATPVLLGTTNIAFPYSAAGDVRAAISANNRVLALSAPNTGATAHFGQVKSTLKLFRLPDLVPLATYSDFLPGSLAGLELPSDGSLTYALFGQNAPGFSTPAWVDKLLAPATLGGGDSATLTIQLPFRVLEASTVTLAASGGIDLPATVTVPANEYQVNVPITVQQTTATNTRTISATLNGIATNLNIAVVPPRPQSLTLNPTTVKGGTSSTATLNIIGVAPAGGLTVTLASNNANAQVPASVVVPAGAKTVNFTVNTSAVATTVNAAAISATANGATSTANLKIEAPKVSAFVLNSSSVMGGDKVKATVTLDGPAPAGGLTVTVNTSLATAVASTTIVVPAGSTTASKSLPTLPVYPDKTVTLTAVYQSSSVAANVQVKAARVVSAIVTPGRGDAGDSVTAYILLSGPASGSYPLTLTINGVTQTVPVTAGAVYVPFTFTVPSIPAGTYTVTIGNDLGGVTTMFEVTD